MAAVITPPMRAVLVELGSHHAVARHWLDAAATCAKHPAQTRRLLARMKTMGLVEGVKTRGGLTYWWKATNAGRAAIATAESVAHG